MEWDTVQANTRIAGDAVVVPEEFYHLRIMTKAGELARLKMRLQQVNTPHSAQQFQVGIYNFINGIVEYSNAYKCNMQNAFMLGRSVINFTHMAQMHTDTPLIYRLFEVASTLHKQQEWQDKLTAIGLLLVYVEQICLINNIELNRLVAA